MKTFATIAAAVLAGTLLACAAARANGGTKEQQRRVSSLMATLDTSLPGDTIPSGWRIVIITDPKDWAKLRANFKTAADVAFSYLPAKVTYLNGQQIEQLDNKTLQWALAHEMGHALCNCSDENKADLIADRLDWRRP